MTDFLCSLTCRRSKRHPHACAARRDRGITIECLEGRRLLSAAIFFGPGPVISSSQGVILHEKVGEKFTSSVGTFHEFLALAPTSGLDVSINWGDGKTSAGSLVPMNTTSGPSKFKVDEGHRTSALASAARRQTCSYVASVTHHYQQPGTYAVTITVADPSWPRSIIFDGTEASIDSTVIVKSRGAWNAA